MADYTRGDDPVYKEFRESHQYNQLQDVNREIDELTYELDEYQALGTVEELAELVSAHKDGRAPILPCKVGDTVYMTIRGVVEETKVRTFFVGHPSYNRGEPDPRYEMIRVTNYDIPLRDFGKTVFLTREEAEAALAKEGDDERD